MDRSYTVECPAIKVTKGALKAIENAGGKILDVAHGFILQNGLTKSRARSNCESTEVEKMAIDQNQMARQLAGNQAGVSELRSRLLFVLLPF